jgi:hypothetical protein
MFNQLAGGVFDDTSSMKSLFHHARRCETTAGMKSGGTPEAGYHDGLRDVHRLANLFFKFKQFVEA